MREAAAAWDSSLYTLLFATLSNNFQHCLDSLHLDTSPPGAAASSVVNTKCSRKPCLPSDLHQQYWYPEAQHLLCYNSISFDTFWTLHYDVCCFVHRHERMQEAPIHVAMRMYMPSRDLILASALVHHTDATDESCHTCWPKGGSSILATLLPKEPTISLQYSAVLTMVHTTGMSSSGILICQSVVPAEAVAFTDPEAVLGKRPISLPAYALSTLCRPAQLSVQCVMVLHEILRACLQKADTEVHTYTYFHAEKTMLACLQGGGFQGAEAVGRAASCLIFYRHMLRAASAERDTFLCNV